MKTKILCMSFILLLSNTLSASQLFVGFKGNGSGTVQVAPLKTDCHSSQGDCTYPYEEPTWAVITAVADEGSVFDGWYGNNEGCKMGEVFVADGTVFCLASFSLPSPEKVALTTEETVPSEEPRTCLGLLCGSYPSEKTDDGLKITGTDGDDVICGSSGRDIIWGRGGDDTICGYNGNDTILAGPGHDRVDGGKDNDTLYGCTYEPLTEEGLENLAAMIDDQALLEDIIEQQALLSDDMQSKCFDVIGNVDDGRDMLDGGPGKDWLFGSHDNDMLFGGRGDDVLVDFSGEGQDLFNGGPHDSYGVDICLEIEKGDIAIQCEILGEFSNAAQAQVEVAGGSFCQHIYQHCMQATNDPFACNQVYANCKRKYSTY